MKFYNFEIKRKVKLEIKFEELGKYEGEMVWVCDYRRPDLNKKPIRSIPPKIVKVIVNEIVHGFFYCSNYALEDKEGCKIINPFAGTPVNIFDNEYECIVRWNIQVMSVIQSWEQRLEVLEQEIRDEINNLDDKLLGMLSK